MKNKYFISILMFLFLVATALAEPIKTTTYEVSESSLNAKLKIGNYEDKTLTIHNELTDPISLAFSLDGDAAKYIKLSSDRITVDRFASNIVNVTFFADRLGIYEGSLLITGGINEEIPINFTITDISGIPVEAVILHVEPLQRRAFIGDTFRYKVDIQNLLGDEPYNIDLYYSIDKVEEGKTFKLNKTFLEEHESLRLNTSAALVKTFNIPEFVRPGEYVLSVRAEYLGLTSHSSSVRFFVGEQFMDYLVLGILPVRWIIFTSGGLLLGLGGFFVYKKKTDSKKRYKGKVDFGTLPQPGPRSIWLGYIAETKKKAYYDLDALTIHTLIAGSTGGGKTVSAEVIIEEALQKGTSVMVFDPTAQWSGFLRKNTQPKMFAIYPKYNMKKKDAKAFNGNVHQIVDARQIIDVQKYMVPGEIHVFAINKLDPKDADILVANTIRQVFKANLPEAPQLKLMIIFDEVHRLLPKFGGSGQGFIQIERGAREFRKWGVGLMLISQVLTDFIGETKANINTELQMRTRDQGDLDRIKNKYGAYMLQSLIKSSTGVGMIENPAFNHGNPFFVAFRPLLHEHARLTDDELSQYNKYNDLVEDVEFEIQQLEDAEIDVFDLKLELKMALDKVKAGSFNMVDIYLEGLRPRIEEHFKKLGKKPKKREVQLVSEEELQRDFEQAQRARQAHAEAHGGKDIGGGAAAQPVKQEKVFGPLKLKDSTIEKPRELVDALNTMSDADFAEYTGGEKNVFAEWTAPHNKEAAEKMKEIKDKSELMAFLEDKVC